MNTKMVKMTKLKKSKELREAFVSSQIEVGIPFQIRALRTQRGMDQKALAKSTGMAQPRISAIESPGYGSFTLDTLKRVAAAFDVALIVRFASFSELVRLSDDFSPDDFVVACFEDDQLNAFSTSGRDTALQLITISPSNFRHRQIQRESRSYSSTGQTGRYLKGVGNQTATRTINVGA